MTYDANGYPVVAVPDLGRIYSAIRDRNCIPFFGAGASTGYSFNGTSVDGIPNGWELTMTLLREAGVAQQTQIELLRDHSNATTLEELRAAMKLGEYDLFKAANCFLYKKNNRRDALDEFLRREVRRATHPRPIHTVIAQIQDIYTVLTTNYDRLFEAACSEYSRDLRLHVHEQFKLNTGIWNCPANLRPPQIILHKMHGCVERDKTMIITRADYIRYLANWRDDAKGMPRTITNRLASATLLFLGYSLSDWDLLTIWEGIVASNAQGGEDVQSFAVMKSVSGEDRQFLQQRNIEVIECDITDFAIALASEFKLQIPQLGIPKVKGGV